MKILDNSEQQNIKQNVNETIANKQICLVCKGKGKFRRPLDMVISLLAGLVVIPYIAFATGGVALFASLMVLYWGFCTKKCKTCDGKGYMAL